MSAKSKRRCKFYRYWLSRKKKEFARQGYPNVSLDDMWNYFDKYLWKKHQPRHIIARIRDISALTPNDYFNYATLMAQVYDVKAINEYDVSELF